MRHAKDGRRRGLGTFSLTDTQSRKRKFCNQRNLAQPLANFEIQGEFCKSLLPGGVGVWRGGRRWCPPHCGGEQWGMRSAGVQSTRPGTRSRSQITFILFHLKLSLDTRKRVKRQTTGWEEHLQYLCVTKDSYLENINNDKSIREQENRV